MIFELTIYKENFIILISQIRRVCINYQGRFLFDDKKRSNFNKKILINLFNHMALFLIGVVEMLVVTAWTKLVTKTQVLASGGVTMVNVLIWYYVLQQIVSDIDNWQIAFVYAAGCAVGTVISVYIFQRHEKSNEIDGDMAKQY